MYKNFTKNNGMLSGYAIKFLLVMKLAVILVCMTILQVTAARSYGQKVTLNEKNKSISRILNILGDQTGYDFFYKKTLLNGSDKVSIKISNASLEDVLKTLLAETSLTFTIDDKIVVIRKKELTSSPVNSLSDNETYSKVPDSLLRGRVINALSNQPISGATITIKGRKDLATTQPNGNFAVMVKPGDIITISYVGYQTKVITVKGFKETLVVAMVEAINEMKDLVVTGIYTRNKESFTGSSATYTQAELKQAGGTNIIQSLKTMDPAFAIRDNIQIGSDPNRLPNLEIRGKSSVLGMRDELGVDPNQPLFILDGFESSLAAVNDLDINRIESITLLKDAASTAIYGSKAANGVVVVETVKPKAGKLQVSYNGNTNISAPDLTSYNLMNSAEKLKFEFLAGRYNPALVETVNMTQEEIRLGLMYNNRLRAVAEGVDTYWLAEPLRVGVSQKHSLYVMGGQGNFMFGLGGGYNGVSGAMKASKREVINGNIDLIYRISKFQFSNKFTVSNTGLTNPIVAFSEYANANPYYRKRNSDGTVEQWLEYKESEIEIGNPLWNASLNSRNLGNNLLLSNYFVSEWTPTNAWRLRARFGLTLDNNTTERFTSPEDSYQIANKILTRRGEFETTTLRGNRYEGDVTLSYAKLINKHRINLVGGGNLNSNESLLQGYGVEGFPVGNFSYPNFASGYVENGMPVYSETVSRSLNGYFNTGYSFDDRLLLDLSLRSSGSSIFGNSRKFNTTWSVGAGWNLHREKFITDNFSWINFLKLRTSIGNPGNQNFESGRTLLTYAFESGMQSYFGLGVRPVQIGNPDLQWQITNDKNVGIDLTALDRRLSVTVDYFHKITDPLLIGIDMPLSSGTQQYFTNAGQQVSQGMMFSTSYFILRDIQRRVMWSLRLNGRTQKVRIDDIGDKLATFNQAGRGTSTTRYYDGADPDDVWVVKSLGIDPSTGKELFLTKNGEYTYDFSYDNEVNVGNTRPDVEGILGSSFTLKGLTLNLNFRYQFGAEVFNTAVRNKVENATFTFNQDKRALYERWTSPGDIRSFKNIRDVNPSPLSSRFVQTDKTVVLESVYAEYQFTGGWIKKYGLGNFKVFGSVRDAMRISNVRAERGIDYPFARVIDAGLSFNF